MARHWGSAAAFALLTTGASVVHGAQWSYRVVAGELSDAHNRFTTHDAGAVVEIDGRVLVKLRPNTVVHADRRPTMLALDAPTKVRTVVLDSEAGGMDVDAPPPTRTTREAVLVHAPRDLSAMTQNGHLEIATTRTRSAVANTRGIAWVGTGDGWHALHPGTAFSSSKLVVSPYPILGAPELGASKHAFSGVAGTASIDGLGWSTVEGAARYAVRLESAGAAGSFESLETLETASPVQPRAFRGVPPGAYAATVSAMDENGIEGAASSRVALAVVGIELPAGSAVDEDGAIRLVEHDAATLTHTSGLVASYGHAQGWVVAPNLVTLFRGETTVVRLRDPRDRAGFDVTFEPRRLALRVSAGPKSVRWPTEPVEISIDPSDHLGPLPASIEARPVVTVGVERVPLEFQRDGAHYHATLSKPPGAGPGPWVVRVDVTDQFGHFLGRDFVEVGVEPPKPVLQGLPKPKLPPRGPRPDTEVASVTRSP